MATYRIDRRFNLKDDSLVCLRKKQLSDIRNVQVEPGNSNSEADDIVFTSTQHAQSFMKSREDLQALPSCREIGATETSLFTQMRSVQNSCNAKLSDRTCLTNESDKTQISTVNTTADITLIFRVSPTDKITRAQSNHVETPGRVVEGSNNDKRNTRGRSRSASKKKARLVGWAAPNSPSPSECDPPKTETQLAWAATKGLTWFILVICTVSLSGNISLMAMVSTDSSMNSNLKMYVMVETATDVTILISTMCVIAWLMFESFRRIFLQEEEQTE